MTTAQWPQLTAVEAAIARLAEQLTVVASEQVSVAAAAGRMLAEDVVADRDSPAVDVSAMDGYAVRCADLRLPVDRIDGTRRADSAAGRCVLPVHGTQAAGSSPLDLLPGQAVRIFTGAAVPHGADCIIRREDTRELPTEVEFLEGATQARVGMNIRRQGENGQRGEVLLTAGAEVDSAAVAAVASFGPSRLAVHRRLRVGVLNTGDELIPPGGAVADWQIRDSNGPTLQAWLDRLPWLEVIARRGVEDRLSSTRQALAELSEQCDAVVLTGGVSMGDTDFVPRAILDLGGQIVFHRLPIRPGKPVLGAALAGKLLLGLPGNPVSVAVTSRVLGLPLLRHLAGGRGTVVRPLVELVGADDARLDLTWYRLVHIDAAGRVALLTSRGSGDVVSLSHSCGFVEVPAGLPTRGPLRLTLW